MADTLTDLDAACNWWASYTDDDYGRVDTATVLRAAHFHPDFAAMCAVLERAMPKPDPNLLAELDRLAAS